jgi:hypothetical protein
LPSQSGLSHFPKILDKIPLLIVRQLFFSQRFFLFNSSIAIDPGPDFEPDFGDGGDLGGDGGMNF